LKSSEKNDDVQPYKLKMKNSLLKLMLVIAACGIAASVSAQFTIVPIFGSTITSDTANTAAIENSINTDIATIDSYIANNVTVNITFQETSSGLGSSSTSLYAPTYGQYYTALQNNQTHSAYDTIAIASLPNQAANPVNGDASIATVGPLLRALGFNASPGGGNPDTTISLNTSIMNLSRSGAQNPSFYDLQAVAQHEIDEALGIGGTGSQLGGGTTGPVGPLDLFRYSAPGVRSYAQGTSIAPYFSINGGAASLRPFNQAGNASDYADWAGTANPHVQDAFGTAGSQPNLDGIELEALDIVGYNLTPAGTALELSAVPETGGSLALMCVGLIVAVAGYHKRTHKTG
jgi:hypothetical protein